jgi:predicted PurR-regulated permease PerM
MSTEDLKTATPGKQVPTETIIRLVVLAGLLLWCFRILQPFLLPSLWGAIIAVAIYPLYPPLVRRLGGRRALASAIVTTVLLLLLLGPITFLGSLLIENAATLTQHVRNDQLQIPPPPESVKSWPLVGEFISSTWLLAATNLGEALKLVQPQLKAIGAWLLEIAASSGIGLLVFIFAFVIAGVLLRFSEGCKRVAHVLAVKLAGHRGEEFANLTSATIQSVARGVLGVAVLQALMAGLGFVAAGVPGAGLWALLCLISAIVQIGVGPIVIPTIIWVFATQDTVTAVLFLIWSLLLMVGDNILKPLLLGRGVDVPMLVIFLGAIGGMLLSGIIGLFVGAIVLALGFKLLQAWLTEVVVNEVDTPPPEN